MQNCLNTWNSIKHHQKKRQSSIKKSIIEFHDEIHNVIVSIRKKGLKLYSFKNLPLYPNVPIKDLWQCKYGANIISKNNLNDEIVEYIKKYNTIPTHIKNRKVAIVEFYDKINNVIVATDPNDTRHYNYETAKKMCDDREIEFAKQ